MIADMMTVARDLALDEADEEENRIGFVEYYLYCILL